MTYVPNMIHICPNKWSSKKENLTKILRSKEFRYFRNLKYEIGAKRGRKKMNIFLFYKKESSIYGTKSSKHKKLSHAQPRHKLHVART